MFPFLIPFKHRVGSHGESMNGFTHEFFKKLIYFPLSLYKRKIVELVRNDDDFEMGFRIFGDGVLMTFIDHF